MMEAYRAGGVLRFSRFVMHRHGMDDGARELDWTEVDRIQLSVAAIQITKKPASQLAFKTPQITLMLPLPMARVTRMFQRFV
jgi:hypothetical protein